MEQFYTNSYFNHSVIVKIEDTDSIDELETDYNLDEYQLAELKTEENFPFHVSIVDNEYAGVITLEDLESELEELKSKLSDFFFFN